MKSLLLIFMLYLNLSGEEIVNCSLRMDLKEDGSAQVQQSLELTELRPGQVDLPIPFPALQELHLREGFQGLSVKFLPGNGQAWAQLQLPEKSPQKARIILEYRVAGLFQAPENGKSALPANHHFFRHVFVQTHSGVMGQYNCEVKLPQGFRVQAIREQLPKPAKSEILPRVCLGKTEDRQSATLQKQTLKLGDRVSMSLEIVPDRRSWLWLAVGLVLSLLYLFRFRDLVKKQC